MEKLKVLHDQQGDHNPLASGKGTKLTDPYTLKGVTLKFVTFEQNRESTLAVWSDIDNGKQYRTDIRLQEDAINGKLYEGKVSTVKGCLITGDFGFKQQGEHVLLTILEPAVDAAAALEYAKEIFAKYLAGQLKGRDLTQEIRLFMKQVNRSQD